MWVARQMGHSDWTMIARVYARWMPTADDTAGMKAQSSFYKPLIDVTSKDLQDDIQSV